MTLSARFLCWTRPPVHYWKFIDNKTCPQREKAPPNTTKIVHNTRLCVSACVNADDALFLPGESCSFRGGARVALRRAHPCTAIRNASGASDFGSRQELAAPAARWHRGAGWTPPLLDDVTRRGRWQRRRCAGKWRGRVGGRHLRPIEIIRKIKLIDLSLI